MSEDCDQTWSKGLPGPSGQQKTVEEREGWALFCNTDDCVEFASGENFYEDSPGKRNASYIGATSTTSTASTTITTSSMATASSSTASLTSSSNLLTSTTETISSTTKSTTASALELITTTRTQKCCEETRDDRDMIWEAMCPDQNGQLVQNRTDGCPQGTTGFAFWTCNPITGNFSPPQPDRTNCYADWVSHVVEMVLLITKMQRNLSLILIIISRKISPPAPGTSLRRSWPTLTRPS